MLSADVNPAVDPNYENVQDKKTASYLGKGIVLTKYTGSRGKSGASDANAEFCGVVRTILNKNNVQWQYGDLGKVDQGGGGTIAQYVANLGVEVLDCGIPVLSMHSPFEVISKIDLYMTYKGYAAFLADRGKP
jgi:aspartyl aminopeptidase